MALRNLSLSLFVLLSLFAFFAAAQGQEEQPDELALAVEDGGDDAEPDDGGDDAEAEDEDEDEDEAPEVDNSVAEEDEDADGGGGVVKRQWSSGRGGSRRFNNRGRNRWGGRGRGRGRGRWRK